MLVRLQKCTLRQSGDSLFDSQKTENLNISPKIVKSPNRIILWDIGFRIAVRISEFRIVNLVVGETTEMHFTTKWVLIIRQSKNGKFNHFSQNCETTK